MLDVGLDINLAAGLDLLAAAAEQHETVVRVAQHERPGIFHRNLEPATVAFDAAVVDAAGRVPVADGPIYQLTVAPGSGVAVKVGNTPEF